MSKVRVLVCDDNREFCELLREYVESQDDLELAGVAYNGVEVLDQVEKTEPDVVVLDIIMPHLGGHDCFLELKKINPKVKVIVSSGYSMNNEAARMLSGGACGFVSKPFDIGKLSKTISDALQKT